MSAEVRDDRHELEALTQFLYLVPIGVVEMALDGEIVMINPMSAQLLIPLSRDGQLHNLFDVLSDVAPDLRHRVQSFGPRYGMVCEGVHLHLYAGSHKAGRPQVLSLTLLKLDGERLMAVVSDVTVAVERDRALRRSQAWIDTLVAGISDHALMSLDTLGRVRCWNAGVERLTGFGAEQTLGHPYPMFYPPDVLPDERAQDRLFEARRDGWSLDEGWRQRADGSRFWGSCLIAPLDVSEDARDGEPAYSFIVRDISDRKDAHDALHRSVYADELTGLANRRKFFDVAEFELQRWLRVPRPLSVVLVDADHFKAVNDRHGHAAGDAVLRHLAATLGASFRAMDLVARVGGEEFAILLPGADSQAAQLVATRLCENVARQPVDADGVTVSCTVSAGVACMTEGVNDVAALMRRADAALYRAKANGRNRVECWTSAMDESGDRAPAQTSLPT